MVHVLVGYIVYHCCLRFDRGEAHVVVVILSTIAILGLTGERIVLLWLFYCFRFDKGVGYVVVIVSTITF